MRVCLDTNVLLQLFGANAPFAAIRRALLAGRLEWALSNEVLLEYEEVVTQLSGANRWRQVARLIDLLRRLHPNIIQVEPTFRFGVIATDPEDNKFVNCTIVAAADFIVTEDRHFKVLTGAGYRSQPIAPRAFIQDYLGQQHLERCRSSRCVLSIRPTRRKLWLRGDCLNVSANPPSQPTAPNLSQQGFAVF